MTQGTQAGDTRRRLLRAASRVIGRDGAQHLTLEAVAREAGVSKGGLLYHFAGKHALITGMVEVYLNEFEERIEDLITQGAAYPRAFVQATLQELGDNGLRASNGALLATLAHDPSLLELFRHAAGEWQSRLEHGGIDPARATLARLAVEGLYFSELLGTSAPQGELRAGVERLLLELTAP